MSVRMVCGLIFLMMGYLQADETKTVTNGVNPVGKKVLHFEEDLRLGPESGDDRHLWTGVDVAMDIDDRGHIFIVDPRGNRILEFGTDGAFVRQIGAKGEGPGEYVALKQFSILADGSAVVLDQSGPISSWSFLDKNMKFVRKQSLSETGKLLRSGSFSPDGKHIAGLYLKFNPSAPVMDVEAGVLNSKLELLVKLRKFEVLQFDMSQIENKDWWSDFVGAWLRLLIKPGLVAFGKDGSIFTTQDGKYEITRYNSSLKKELVFGRQYMPIHLSAESLDAFMDPFREEILATLPEEIAAKVNDEIIEKALEKAEVVPRKNPIFGMISLNDGTLLVVADYNPKTGASKGDLFSTEGVYVGSTSLPPVAANIFGGFFGSPVKMKAKGNNLYVLEQNEDGEFTLVRYKYKLGGP